jgi:hypothetical protein
MLFPLYGDELYVTRTVRPEYWRIAFLGSLVDWKRENPTHEDASKVTDDLVTPIVTIHANECFSHGTWRFTFPVATAVWKGVPYTPVLYENLDVYHELPKHDVDHDLQFEWRRPYQDRACKNVARLVESRIEWPYGATYAALEAEWIRRADIRRSALFGNDF